MVEAVDMYRTEKAKPAPQKVAQTIAKEYGIENQWRMIVNRYKGGRSTQEAHEDQQKLTGAEEAVLVDFLNQSADHGFPQMR